MYSNEQKNIIFFLYPCWFISVINNIIKNGAIIKKSNFFVFRKNGFHDVKGNIFFVAPNVSLLYHLLSFSCIIPYFLIQIIPNQQEYYYK